MIAKSKTFCCALVVALAATYSIPSVAQTPSAQSQGSGTAQPFKRSTLELRGSLGGIDSDNSDLPGAFNDTDTAHAAFGYWYNFNRNFSGGVSYLDGESDDFDFVFFGLLNDTKLEYNAVMVDIEGRLPLGRENYLFARAGAAFYDYDLIDDGENALSDDGTDIHFAAGWTKRWQGGFGIQVMYEYLGLGSDLEVSAFGAGISYSF